MNVQINENEQWDAIKAWWKVNGLMTVGLVIAAIILGFGVKYWQQNKQQKLEQASLVYDQLQLASITNPGEQTQIHQFAQTLQTEYPHTPYASLATLVEAKQAVEKNDFSQAVQKLQWVIAYSPASTLQQIARLREARILLAQNQPNQAIAVLSKVDDNSYAAAVDQVKGDIYLSEGKKPEARAAYTAALTKLPSQEPLRNYLTMQIQQLQ